MHWRVIIYDDNLSCRSLSQSEKKNMFFLFSLFERKTVATCLCTRFVRDLRHIFGMKITPNNLLCVAWSFLGPKNHWLEPEDQRDTTVPSTLLRPAAITSPICPLCPCAQNFRGRMGIAKAIKVSLHHWEDRRLRLQQGLRFPVSKLLDVSAAVFAFYKTLGFRFTMQVFQQEEN